MKSPLANTGSRTLGRSLAITAAVGTIVTGAIYAADTAQAAAVSCYSLGHSLSYANLMSKGQCITSTNNQYTLVMQTDGNLVSYRNSDHTVCFNAATSGSGATDTSVVAGGKGARYPIYLEVITNTRTGGTDRQLPGSGSGILNVSLGNDHGEVYVGYTTYQTGRC